MDYIPPNAYGEKPLIDNDPTRFLSYLVEALRSVDTDLEDNAENYFQSPGSGSLDAAAADLMNQLDSDQAEFLLVLDDYHYIRMDAIHRVMAFFLDHQPPRMHIFILTREDPPIPVGRLRANR